MSPLKKTLLAAAAVVLPAAAQAQPVNGVYVGAGLGANYLQDIDADGKGPGFRTYLQNSRFSGSPSYEWEFGGVGLISVGYGFGNGLRAEVEGSVRYNELSDVKGNANLVNSKGGMLQYGLMANALYDFDMGWGFTPYLGLGAGVVWSDTDKATVTSSFNRDRLQVDDFEASFAYQAIVGAAFPISDVPGLSATVEYRFMGTLESDAKAVGYRSNGATPAKGSVEMTNYNHSLLVGLRYAFGAAPAPVAAVAPAPAQQTGVARTYLVFFDWDRSDLTDRARQIISEAAANSKRVSSTRLEVSGHADRSGTPQYNMRLSQRRAETVAAELVRQGVSRNEIVIQAFGESRPLVATADGVREPQNRRVEIVLR
jgi:OOP family OmpA-OmpF porin